MVAPGSLLGLVFVCGAEVLGEVEYLLSGFSRPKDKREFVEPGWSKRKWAVLVQLEGGVVSRLPGIGPRDG